MSRVRAVWKFPLREASSIAVGRTIPRVDMPLDSEFRLFAYDEKISSLCVWYEILLANKDKLETRTFYVIGTGDTYIHRKWLASCITPHGYVVHLYQGPTFRNGE